MSKLINNTIEAFDMYLEDAIGIEELSYYAENGVISGLLFDSLIEAASTDATDPKANETFFTDKENVENSMKNGKDFDVNALKAKYSKIVKVSDKSNGNEAKDLIEILKTMKNKETNS